MLPRFVPVDEGETTFVPLEELIAAQPGRALPGDGDRRPRPLPRHPRRRLRRSPTRPTTCCEAVEDELRRRRFGEVVRVEVEAGHEPGPARASSSTRCASRSARSTTSTGCSTSTTSGRSSACPGFAELRDDAVDAGDPAAPGRAEADEQDIFAVMREGDILVHHPYDSFATSVERFVEQAVDDPDVLAIKQTVYRTSDDSPLVPSLIRADRARQAGGLPGRAQGALRRAREHHVGAQAGGGGRPRRLRHARAQDARQVPPRRAPRGRRRAPLRARRHRQLPPQDGAPVHRLRPASPATSGSAPTSPTCSTSSPATRARARYREVLVAPELLRDGIMDRDRAHDRRAPPGPPRAHRAEDELAGGPRVHRGRSTAPRRPACRSTSTSAASAAWCRASPASRRTSASSRSSAASSSTRASTRSSTASELDVLIGSADLMPRNLDTRVELVTPVRDPTCATT